MQEIGLVESIKGQLDLDFTVNEPTQIIVYNRKLEFPKENLKLGISFVIECV